MEWKVVNMKAHLIRNLTKQNKESNSSRCFDICIPTNNDFTGKLPACILNTSELLTILLKNKQLSTNNSLRHIYNKSKRHIKSKGSLISRVIFQHGKHLFLSYLLVYMLIWHLLRKCDSENSTVSSFMLGSRFAVILQNFQLVDNSSLDDRFSQVATLLNRRVWYNN